MTPGERIHYHTKLWPAAALANEWFTSDADKRRQVALDCMREVRGPLVTTSNPAFGRDEVTALFCYLEHLADPASLDKAARWVTCKADYHTYNLARQADWHERKLYGTKANKLDKNRFAGARTARGGPLDDLDPVAVRKRHMTFASRHQKADPSIRRMQTAGQNPAGQPPASAPSPAPVDADAPF